MAWDERVSGVGKDRAGVGLRGAARSCWIAVALIAAGCDLEEKQEEARSAAEERLEDAKDRLRDKVDDARDKVDDTVDDAKDKLEDAKDRVRDKVDDAKHKIDETKETIDGARTSMRDARDDLTVKVSSARSWATDLTSTGELSSTARSWLTAAGEQGSLEHGIARGTQVAPVALAIGGKLLSAVDRDTVLEPVYQPTSAVRADGETGNAAVDAAIRDMGRVEVIDGLSVGFKKLSTTSTKQHITESGYLVLWRQDDHLIGFVYRARRAVDIESLVGDAPELVKLAREGAAAS